MQTIDMKTLPPIGVVEYVISISLNDCTPPLPIVLSQGIL